MKMKSLYYQSCFLIVSQITPLKILHAASALCFPLEVFCFIPALIKRVCRGEMKEKDFFYNYEAYKISKFIG